MDQSLIEPSINKQGKSGLNGVGFLRFLCEKLVKGGAYVADFRKWTTKYWADFLTIEEGGQNKPGLVWGFRRQGGAHCDAFM